MGFKIKEDAGTFNWQVTAWVPEDGKHKPVKFTATYKVISQSEINRMMEEGEGGSMRVLDAALISFTGVDPEYPDGTVAEDLEERKRILFQFPFFVAAVSNAYAEGMSGHKPKN